jgi:hypothetical protein
MPMVDYKPQFRPIDPTYTGASLVDRVSNAYYGSFKDRSWKEIRDDFVVTTRNDTKKTLNDIVENKILYASITAGVAVGVAANFIGAYICDIRGASHDIIEKVSLRAELIFHAVGYAGVYIGMGIAAGMSGRKIAKDLIKSLIIATPIATLPYPWVRNPLADLYMNLGVMPEKATVLSQITLLPAYAKAVKYAIKIFGDRVGEHMDIAEERIDYIVDKVAEKIKRRKVLKNDKESLKPVRKNRRLIESIIKPEPTIDL